MSQNTGQMELREADIRKHYPAALALLQGFDHAPRIGKPVASLPERSPGIGARRAFRATTPGLAATRSTRNEGVHLIETIEELNSNDGLMSPAQSAVLNAARRAIAVARAVGDQFADISGLADLKRANLQGGMAPSKSVEFAEALSAEALATLHVFGSFLTFALADRVSDVTVDQPDVVEVLTENAMLAMQGALWELERQIEGREDSDEHLVARVVSFAEVLMEKVAARAANAPRLGAFVDGSWRTDDGFTVNGFTAARAAKSTTLTMQFKKPHEVVGNHIAKYQAMKLAKMLMAYDFDRKMNPFADLGGFIFTFMGDGAPGTGKTTLIQMMAGMVHDYCQIAGYPFRYQNFGIDNIDSYQGKSGQNAKAFINTVLDPSVIGFGTIDDIDQIAGKRGDRQSSAGQQEVTAVFMEAFAGANTVVRGNCTFGMFSNFPENVDDALRQRAGARFLVDGPQTREDYIDILSLLLGKNHDIPLGQHDLFSAQQIKRAVARSFESHNRPKEARLEKVFDRLHGQIGQPDTIAKLGTYLKAIQEADPRFTGRAIKNITDAVKVRAMDFELPDEWMENPDLFLRKDYDTKRNMIADLRQPITTDMVLQEINRYADSEFRYAGKSDEAAIEQMVRDRRLSEEAKRRYLEGKA